MDYGFSAEVDHTVPLREFIGFLKKSKPALEEAFKANHLAEADWQLNYCPILMSKWHIRGYPARSRCSHKKRILNCSPQLDHTRYLKGNQSERRAIALVGLFDAVKLMEKAKFTKEQIEEYEAILRGLIDGSDIA